VQDVGRAINPALVEAQIHGGGAQGVGWGLYEEIAHDESGAPITASLMDYTIPKARQVPELDVTIVEVPSTIGPFGAKPIGEPPVIPGGAVMANAIHAAVGVRMTHLPVTSERVLKALEASQEQHIGEHPAVAEPQLVNGNGVNGANGVHASNGHADSGEAATRTPIVQRA